MEIWKLCGNRGVWRSICIPLGVITQGPVRSAKQNEGNAVAAGEGSDIVYGNCCFLLAAKLGRIMQLSWLDHRIPTDELALSASLQSHERIISVCCVAPWSCDIASEGTEFLLKDLTSCCDYTMYKNL
jgi:hypothetical protein